MWSRAYWQTVAERVIGGAAAAAAAALAGGPSLGGVAVAAGWGALTALAISLASTGLGNAKGAPFLTRQPLSATGVEVTALDSADRGTGYRPGGPVR